MEQYQEIIADVVQNGKLTRENYTILLDLNILAFRNGDPGLLAIYRECLVHALLSYREDSSSYQNFNRLIGHLDGLRQQLNEDVMPHEDQENNYNLSIQL